ncbi:MAG: acyl-CoA dehydrogenase family protein [Myxococcota bacterium]|nr:acyl-CoA dehydrogenase family protein [Myxococcota bacterium]
MNQLNEEQTMMVDAARKLVRETIIEPRVDMALDKSGEFPHEVYRVIWESGLANLEFPEEVGGAGLSCYDHCLITQEIQYGCLGIGTSVTANNLAAMPVIIAGNEAQKKKYLGMLTEEPLYAAYACSEPDAGSDVAAMSTRFEKKGDKYILNGVKRWITNADVASWYLVFAREDGTKGHKGVAAFIVEADYPGASTDGLVHKMGQRASHTCDVILENVEVPAENMIAGPEDGFKLAMGTFDRSRPWISCAAAGVIRRARDESLRYALERKTFGTPIINHQMVASMIADMEIAYTATHLMTMNAAASVDRGDWRGTHSACAKAYGADAAMQVTTDAVQVFGGYGYTDEYVVEKLMRDTKLLQIYEGTSQIQRMVIARDLVRHAQSRA